MDEEIKQAFSTLLGRTVAHEYAIKLLLCTHPKRALLACAWDGLLLQQIDELMQNPVYMGDATMREAIHAQLAALRQYLDFDVPGFSEDDLS